MIPSQVCLSYPPQPVPSASHQAQSSFSPPPKDAPTPADVTSPSTPRRPLHEDGTRSHDQHDPVAAHAISENEIVSVLERAAANNDPGVEKLLAEFRQVQADHESPEQLQRWRAHVSAFLETTGVEKQAEVRGRDATVESSSVSN